MYTFTSVLPASVAAAGPTSTVPPSSAVAAVEGRAVASTGAIRSTRIRGPKLVVRFLSFFLRRLAAIRPSRSAVPVSLSVYPPQLLAHMRYIQTVEEGLWSQSRPGPDFFARAGAGLFYWSRSRLNAPAPGCCCVTWGLRQFL